MYKLLSFLLRGEFFGAQAEKYRVRLKNANIIIDGKATEYTSKLIHRDLKKCRVESDSIKVDVIIPVYKGLQETQACVSSVLKNLPDWAELIVINDASPDVLLSEWLCDQAKEQRFSLITNDVNLGFVKTVNHGMMVNPTHDVVLLNSDTEVANNWLERMKYAAYSMEKIASITPFSNNGYLCSFPVCFQDNELPRGMSVGDVDDIFINLGRKDELIELPTGVGFCMYMRRECLNEIGLFDAEAFGRGYGEEADWCQRAFANSWLNCQPLNLFVYHKGSMSFGKEGKLLIKNAKKMLKKRYPEFEERENLFQMLDPTREFREELYRHMKPIA